MVAPVFRHSRSTIRLLILLFYAKQASALKMTIFRMEIPNVSGSLSEEQMTKLRQFEDLIAVEKANENEIQTFLEANTAFMPTPDIIGYHGLHLNSVIAKFPVGERFTDYAYLCKNSIEWRLVLVELEDSNKRIFKRSGTNGAFTAAFSDAVAQIDVWRDHATDHLDQLREKLRPLMVPPQMFRNKLSVQYMLVIGRSAELEQDEKRRLRLANYGNDRDLRIITYDTIAREVRSGGGKAKAVLRANSRGFRLQSTEGMPSLMFSHIMPEHLELSSEAEAGLRANQYDIDAWKRNEPLIFNEKWTLQTAEELQGEVHPAVRSTIDRLKDR